MWIYSENWVIERFKILIGLGLFQTIVTVTSTVFNNTNSSIYLVTALRASSHPSHLWRVDPMIGMIAALNLLFPWSSQASRYVRTAFLVIRGKGGFSFLLLLACFRHLLISSSCPRFLSSPTLLCHPLVTSQIQHSTHTRISNFRRPEGVLLTKGLLLFLRVSATTDCTAMKSCVKSTQMMTNIAAPSSMSRPMMFM